MDTFNKDAADTPGASWRVPCQIGPHPLPLVIQVTLLLAHTGNLISRCSCALGVDDLPGKSAIVLLSCDGTTSLV